MQDQPTEAGPEAEAAPEGGVASPEADASPVDGELPGPNPDLPANAPATDQPESAKDAPPLPPDFDDVMVKPYRAYTVGTPLSIVNEVGQLIATVGQPGTKVTVLAEGSVRVKVRCDGCSPVVEGYLQKERVRK